MFGKSSNSAKTNTPGADVAFSMSLAAAAPFALFDMSRNGSSFEVKFAPRSMAGRAVAVGRGNERWCTRQH